jgi:hypothetical protein
MSRLGRSFVPRRGDELSRTPRGASALAARRRFMKQSASAVDRALSPRSIIWISDISDITSTSVSRRKVETVRREASYYCAISGSGCRLRCPQAAVRAARRPQLAHSPSVHKQAYSRRQSGSCATSVGRSSPESTSASRSTKASTSVMLQPLAQKAGGFFPLLWPLFERARRASSDGPERTGLKVIFPH